jgi:hypothetical protein
MGCYDDVFAEIHGAYGWAWDRFVTHDEYMAVVYHYAKPFIQREIRRLEVLRKGYAEVIKVNDCLVSPNSKHGLCRPVYDWMKANVKGPWIVECIGGELYICMDDVNAAFHLAMKATGLTELKDGEF